MTVCEYERIVIKEGCVQDDDGAKGREEICGAFDTARSIQITPQLLREALTNEKERPSTLDGMCFGDRG